MRQGLVTRLQGVVFLSRRQDFFLGFRYRRPPLRPGTLTQTLTRDLLQSRAVGGGGAMCVENTPGAVRAHPRKLILRTDLRALPRPGPHKQHQRKHKIHTRVRARKLEYCSFEVFCTGERGRGVGKAVECNHTQEGQSTEPHAEAIRWSCWGGPGHSPVRGEVRSGQHTAPPRETTAELRPEINHFSSFQEKRVYSHCCAPGIYSARNRARHERGMRASLNVETVQTRCSFPTTTYAPLTVTIK